MESILPQASMKQALRLKTSESDPGKNLLERWKSCTETTGMGFLRSPSVHNLATEPMSLMALAESLDVPNQNYLPRLTIDRVPIFQ